MNFTKYNYIAVGQAPPLQLSFAIGSPGDCIHVAGVVTDLGVLVDNSFSPFINCREATSKASRMLFMVRRSFAELCVSAFSPLYITLVWPYIEYAMQVCSANLVSDDAYYNLPKCRAK